MKEIIYNRNSVVAYAKEWAYRRNPAYLDFEEIGGDCTSFTSQCIYAGCNIMNYSKENGWYYISSSNRAPSWTSVQYLYKFLTTNTSVGPYGVDSNFDKIDLGDIIQFGTLDGTYYHSLVVVSLTETEIYVAAHTFDAFMRPLSSYEFEQIRFIHIIAARIW